MTGNALLQCGLYVLVLVALGVPLGRYIARVYQGASGLAGRVLGPLERLLYRLSGVKPDEAMGADDYLTKPFGVNELLARMRVALRHARRRADGGEVARIEAGALVLDLARREVLVAGAPVHLTPIEYKLLALLATHAGKVLTHRQILREVWGPSHASQSHYVRVHMAELRKKIEPGAARPRLILTEPGVGYRFDDRALVRP